LQKQGTTGYKSVRLITYLKSALMSNTSIDAKDILTSPFRFLYKVYVLLFFAVIMLLYFPVFSFLLAKKSRFPTAFRFIKGFSRLWIWGCGIFISVKGKENIIRDKPFIICSNHSSFIDPAVLYSIFPQHFVFTGKKEIEKWPLFHIFYTSGMNILIDRHSRIGAMKGFKVMMQVLEDGFPLVILPEGTIPKDAPKLGEFKSGVTALAIQQQIPIIPVTQTTNWKRLQRRGIMKGKASPGLAKVIIHPPIETKGLTKSDANELLTTVRNTINEPLHEKYGV
jgi:1-acyl-sn-glycerol-3-phosphate acyltransferase